MKQTAIWILIAAVIIFTAVTGYRIILKYFLPHWESFSARPYWDHKQWSWGYGTRVPGSVNDKNIKPAGSITRAQAFTDMMAHVDRDYSDLKKLISVPLTSAQWAAYLSFSYNLGVGNADNLVFNINNKNIAALQTQWNSYINVRDEAGNLVPSSNLIARRAAEWDLFAKT
jgi:GH24 family phage-related lysozyme (muramidase)